MVVSERTIGIRCCGDVYELEFGNATVTCRGCGVRWILTYVNDRPVGYRQLPRLPESRRAAICD